MNAQTTGNSADIHKPIHAAAADLINDAFEQGRCGYSQGAANPHEGGSVLFHVWNIGHDAADLEHDTLTAALDARC